MTRDKQFRNRKGREAGGSRVHLRTMAELKHKYEHFMSHRDMRAYWNDYHAEIYGPLRLMSRWLSYRENKRRRYAAQQSRTLT